MIKYPNCDYDFCIYNDSKKCMLDDIGINAEGCCDNILLPDIPKDELNRYKLETFLLLKKNKQ
ncbi:MAG: hypothetical protein FWE84_05700 [Firmicutes bacterium]|nr:hypothetical protein [Bacillota bacterium]